MTDEAMSPLRRRMDRRHNDPQVRAEDPTRLCAENQELRRVSRAIARSKVLQCSAISRTNITS